jgi:hypothetical protein
VLLPPCLSSTVVVALVAAGRVEVRFRATVGARSRGAGSSFVTGRPTESRDAK